jgi:catechol 2,3-dioxygenase-like lactoylglutathione lyase family enzyme
MTIATQVRSEAATGSARPVDMKFEVTAIPVSDVDRAKRFYGNLGWRLDADFVVGDTFRGVQFTPPGSRLQAPPPRFTSARESHRPRRARRAGSFSSSPTSRRRAPSSSAAASM